MIFARKENFACQSGANQILRFRMADFRGAGTPESSLQLTSATDVADVDPLNPAKGLALSLIVSAIFWLVVGLLVSLR